MTRRTLVWDLPVRIGHWLLVASFAGAWLTAGSERYRDIHVTLGWTVGALVVFRLLWGFTGTRHARFGAFLYGPRAVAGYLRSLFTRAPRHYVGHNPAGSWAIWSLLALAAATAVTGWLAYAEIGGEALCTAHAYLANALAAMAVVHVAGVVASSLRHRENLVGAMLTGRKDAVPQAGIASARRGTALALLVAVLTFWGWRHAPVPVAPVAVTPPVAGASLTAG